MKSSFVKLVVKREIGNLWIGRILDIVVKVEQNSRRVIDELHLRTITY